MAQGSQALMRWLKRPMIDAFKAWVELVGKLKHQRERYSLVPDTASGIFCKESESDPSAGHGMRPRSLSRSLSLSNHDAHQLNQPAFSPSPRPVQMRKLMWRIKNQCVVNMWGAWQDWLVALSIKRREALGTAVRGALVAGSLMNLLQVQRDVIEVVWSVVIWQRYAAKWRVSLSPPGCVVVVVGE
eukprot:2636422-Rhodomonas_salina.1